MSDVDALLDKACRAVNGSTPAPIQIAVTSLAQAVRELQQQQEEK